MILPLSHVWPASRFARSRELLFRRTDSLCACLGLASQGYAPEAEVPGLYLCSLIPKV